MYTKIAQLILSPGATAGTSAEVYVAQPDSAKEALAGKLFLLIEIESKKVDNLKFINFLISELSHNYYQGDKMILRERLSTLKIEHILESALARTNKSLFDFLQKEKIKIDQKSINVTAGVIYETELYFSTIGKNRAFLIYKNKRTGEQDKYKISEVSSDPDSAEDDQPDRAKFFTNVISGSIPEAGYFIFTNETLPEYLSNKQLIEIITTLPPAGSAEQIKNILSKVNAYVSFLAVIIKNNKGLIVRESQAEVVARQARSADYGLRQAEDKTEMLLAPYGLINIKKLTAKIKSLFFEKKPAPEGSGKEKLIIKDKLIFKKRTGFRAVRSFFGVAKNVVFRLIKFIFNLPKYFTGKPSLGEPYDKIKSAGGSIGGSLAAWFKGLNKKNKILFVIAIVSLIFLAQNLVFKNYKNRVAEETNNYDELVAQIEQKQNQVEASFIYNNEEGAKKILMEIKDLLNQLPQASKEQKEKLAALGEKNEEQLEKIRHFINITKIDELANFANLNSQANPANLIMAGDKIYAADPSLNLVNILNLKDNLVTATDKLAGGVARLDYPSLNNNNIYYFAGDNIIQLSLPQLSFTKLSLAADLNYQNFVAAFVYNNRLYAADKKEGQIYRFNRGGNTYNNPAKWLNEKENFELAAGMYIDGNIYVLRSDGSLTKYLKGKKLDFSLSLIEPPLASADKLAVTEKYIYVLDKQTRRIAVFDAEGKFVLQYGLDSLAGVKDFIPDEAGRKIYLLSNSSVVSFALEHL